MSSNILIGPHAGVVNGRRWMHAAVTREQLSTLARIDHPEWLVGQPWVDSALWADQMPDRRCVVIAYELLAKVARDHEWELVHLSTLPTPAR